jgi:hypothetical protein
VVERFVPEMEKGRYVLRWAFFMGSAQIGLKGFSNDPIVRVANQTAPSQLMSEIHPEVLRYRKAIGLDYGKIDYVIHEGRPVIVDVNKTIGGTREEKSPLIQTLIGVLANGLHFDRIQPGPAESQVKKGDVN